MHECLVLASEQGEEHIGTAESIAAGEPILRLWAGWRRHRIGRYTNIHPFPGYYWAGCVFLFKAAIPSPVRLCAVCGCRGPLTCGKCRASYYCGATHQRVDWSHGGHKNRCGTNLSTANVTYDCLFKEYELVTELEPLPDNTNRGESAEEAENRRLKDYEEYLKNKEEDDDMKDVPDDEFNKYAAHIDEDVVFGKFRKRVELEKDQVRIFKFISFCSRDCVLDSWWIAKCSLLLGNSVRARWHTALDHR